MLVVVYDQEHDKTFRYKLSESCTTQDVANALANNVKLKVEDMRLIAAGRELESSEVLQSTLGEYFFRTKHITLKELDKDACREWQRHGRCKIGSDCPYKASHTMDKSPRYVEFQAKTGDGSNAGGSSSGSESASPRCSPCSTPPKLSPREEKPKTVCRNWERDGSCRFGDRCHFAHTPKVFSPSCSADSTPSRHETPRGSALEIQDAPSQMVSPTVLLSQAPSHTPAPAPKHQIHNYHAPMESFQHQGLSVQNFHQMAMPMSTMMPVTCPAWPGNEILLSEPVLPNQQPGHMYTNTFQEAHGWHSWNGEQWAPQSHYEGLFTQA